jgi:putative DNA primase/helicase
MQKQKLSDFNDLYAELLKKNFSKEVALGEVQLQLKNKDIDVIINVNDEENKSNEKSSSNITKIKTFINYPNISPTGKALDTRDNLKYLLDLYGIIVRWNIMARKREIIIPNVINFVDEEENASLADIYHLATVNELPNKRIDKHLDSLAWLNTYHPIVECIKENPWDGTARLDAFIDTLKTTNNYLARKIIKRWMLSAIAAAFSEKGFTTQGVLVLQGQQNIGKTKWVKSLDPIDCNAVKEGAILDPNNKDSVITLSQFWIVELGELDGTFRKSDIARLKAFITNQVDNIRMPFKEKNSRLSRRTAFVATVNETRYLVDDTGNRRWWTITVESINLKHGLNMQQIWAEVYHLWNNSEQTWLTDEELKLINESNVDYEQLDPFEEKVLEYFNWEKGWQNHNTQLMDATQVLKAIGYDNPKKPDSTRMGKILTKLTGVKPNRRHHTLPRKRYY